MMTIIDILIYVAFAFFASSLARKSENYIEENDLPPQHWDKYLTYFVLFFAIIGGIRWMVGSDNISYAMIFNYKDDRLPEVIEKEQLWWGMVKLIHACKLHWSIGLGVCAFLQYFFIVKTIQPYRWLLIFIPFVIFGGRYWDDTMGAVRQMIVACMFLWASRFIYSREIWKYMLTMILGVMIHQSALILLPLYFIPLDIDIQKHKNTLLTILIVCFILGLTPAFQGLSGYIQIIADATNYDDYSTKMSEMLMPGETNEALAFGPMMLSYLLIPIFIIWFGPELEEKYSGKIPYFNVWFNLAYFYACAYFLVCNISHIYIRPVLYFSMFQMVMAALLLYHLWTEYTKFGLRQTVTLLFCCIIAVNTVWNVAKASESKIDIATYKISFFHKDQQQWFNLQ